MCGPTEMCHETFCICNLYQDNSSCCDKMMPTLTVTPILPLHSCQQPKVNKGFSPLVLKITATLQRTLSLGSFLDSLLCVSCNDLLMQYEICMRFHRTSAVHRMKRFTSASAGIGSETLLLVLVTSFPDWTAAIAGSQRKLWNISLPPYEQPFFFFTFTSLRCMQSFLDEY